MCAGTSVVYPPYAFAAWNPFGANTSTLLGSGRLGVEVVMD